MAPVKHEFLLVYSSAMKLYFITLANSVKSNEGIKIINKFQYENEAMEALIEYSEKEKLTMKEVAKWIFDNE